MAQESRGAITTSSPKVSLDYHKMAQERVEQIIKEHNLAELYFLGEKEKDDEKEKKRLEENWEKFNRECKGRLLSLYQEKFKELGVDQNTTEDGLSYLMTQDGLDERVVDAFRARKRSNSRLDKQAELFKQVDEMMKGNGPSLIDKMLHDRVKDLRVGSREFDAAVSNAALGRDSVLTANANAPRYAEQRLIKRNLERLRDEKEVCQLNFNAVLENGNNLGGGSYEELDLARQNLTFSSAVSNAAMSGANSLFNEFRNIVSGPKEHHGSSDKQQLSNWGRYRELEEKERILANSFSGSINFISEDSLNKLDAILEKVHSQIKALEATNPRTPQNNLWLYDLKQYVEQVEKSKKDLKNVMESQKKSVGNEIDKLKGKTDADMQEALDDKNARLKWNLLCMLLMASPFAQGLVFAGPLFDYLNFLGDILGPVFLHEDGFAAGFAYALENFPIFGEFIKLIRFSDGVELFFNEVPLLNAITGQGGVIDGLTRNEIFTGIVGAINFEYLSLAGMIGGAAYFATTNFNARFGDDTTNTKKSIKQIREKHLESLKNILSNAAKDSKATDEEHAFKYNKMVVGSNRNYFKQSLVAQILEKSLDDPIGGDLNAVLDIFKGEVNLDGLSTKEEKIDKVLSYFDGNADSEFFKKAMVFSDEMLKCSSASDDYHQRYDHIAKMVASKDFSQYCSIAKNNFAMRYYESEMNSLPYVPVGRLREMSKLNEAGNFSEAERVGGELGETIALERSRIDRDNNMFFRPKSIVAPNYHEQVKSSGKTGNLSGINSSGIARE
ncbi:MAG: hypothetical protein ISQ34_00825 [Rickettsiales bacterium]|nr:hypothetical protein [Rickettsiales bacterium]